MKQDLTQELSMQQERWATVMYDVDAVDGDIELLIGMLARRHGYSRKAASAELIRKLSQAA